MPGPSEREQVSPQFDRSEEEQALTVFNHAGEEIRFFKNQQWNVTNYALAAYGAVVATQQLLDDTYPKAVTSWICSIVVLVTALAAGVVLWRLNKAHDKERTRMNKARCKLPVVTALHADGRVDGSVIYGLAGALVFGLLLAIWIISPVPWARASACLGVGAV